MSLMALHKEHEGPTLGYLLQLGSDALGQKALTGCWEGASIMLLGILFSVKSIKRFTVATENKQKQAHQDSGERGHGQKP